MEIYRYGGMAWFWRFLAGLGYVAFAACVAASVHLSDAVFLLIGAPIFLPALILPWMLVTSVRTQGEAISVVTLWGWRRSIDRSRLGTPRVKQTAQGSTTQIAAPRAWVPVRGTLPLYLDLLAQISDQTEFRRVFNIRT